MSNMCRIPMLARIGMLTVLMGLALPSASRSADHNEAPATQADSAADIADLYAWHDTDRDRLTTIMTVAGLQDPSEGCRTGFDRGVLYSFNIDSDGDFVEDTTVDIRFFRTRFGRSLMAVKGLPGAPRFFVVPVGYRVRIPGGAKIYAGLRDDPFFFDFEGFTETLQTGTLSFDGTRDSFAGLNVSAIALEMPLSKVASGNTLNLWATTARR